MDREKEEEEEEEEEEEGEAPPMDGDILEAILSHMPLIDLLPASHVSTTWNRAVSTSIRSFNKLEPWLVVHTQSHRSSHKWTTHAYDPQSQIWIEINQPPIKHLSALRSSHSNLVYMLSPSTLSFSFDPLHLTWRHVDGPLVWRMDPLVALVGRRVVVAGGATVFEEDPLAVEVYDVDSLASTRRQSMPAALKGSASSTSLSVATDDRRMFVTEKSSGVTHTFDPETNDWSGPYDLRPDPSVFCSVVATANNRLILIGVIGEAEDVKGVKVWEVNTESFECELIGEMPEKFVDKMKGESYEVSSISVCSAGDVMYVYNPSEIREVFVCELRDGGCTWGSVTNIVDDVRRFTHRVVVTCSNVGIIDARKALSLEKRRFWAEYFS